jgi:transcriptional regulator with XRE-family HTH domain
MPLDSTAIHAVERLPRAQLVLAIAQAQRDRWTVADVQARLWREDPQEVVAIFAAVETVRATQTHETGIGLLAERERKVVLEARKAAPKARGGRGLTLEEVAQRIGVSRATLAALMEHHGLLDMAPYGRDQRRLLASDATVAQGLGHNVKPGGKRVGVVEGYGKAAPFPVFYEDRLAEVLWVLDLDGIGAEVAQRENRATRLEWLLEHHGYLPGAELAALSGYSMRAVRNAQAARSALGSYRRDDEKMAGGAAFSLLGWARENVPAPKGRVHSEVIGGKDREMDREAA